MVTFDEKLVNLSNSNKRSDRFYVKFMNLPENVSNILGRQLSGIGRPEISFAPITQNRKGFQYKEKGSVNFQPITATFFDDDNSVTSTLIYAQIMRQLNRYTDIFGRLDAGDERFYLFDMVIDYYNAAGSKVDQVILRDCFISSIAHGDSMYSDDAEKKITVSFEYSNLEFPMFEEVRSSLNKIDKV